MTAEWLFTIISVIYRQIMDLLGMNNRKPVEHSEEGMASRNIVLFLGQIVDRIIFHTNIPSYA